MSENYTLKIFITDARRRIFLMKEDLRAAFIERGWRLNKMVNESRTNGGETLGGETTALLRRWSKTGDEAAFEELKKHVDAELRRLAANYLNGAKNLHILQPTIIVQDFYLRLLQLEKDAGERKIFTWNNRSNFIAFAADVMRRIFIDYIRKEVAGKRGGDRKQVTLADDLEEKSGISFEEVLEVHEALEELEKLNPTQAKIVVLRFFGGFNFDEITRICGCSESTARRSFEDAKKWIYERLGD